MIKPWETLVKDFGTSANVGVDVCAIVVARGNDWRGLFSFGLVKVYDHWQQTEAFYAFRKVH